MFKIILGDALTELNKIEEHSVNLIAVDLPYGTTQNKWDVIIPINDMWSSFNRVLDEYGIIVLTATQPFASKLIMSNQNDFKYDIIWEKTISSGQLNVNKQPMRSHEHILVFYKKFKTYNEQFGVGEPYTIKRKAPKKSNYGEQKDSELINEGTRRARSVIEISNPRIRGGHPTQKPVELMDYIIKTYSNENDIVLDCCMGAGTTGISAIKNNRNFIGIELDENYFSMAFNNLIQ